MMFEIIQAVSFVFSFLALMGAGLFFWFDRKVAGFAFLVMFIVAFSAVLNQRIVLSSMVVGLTVERHHSEK